MNCKITIWSLHQRKLSFPFHDSVKLCRIYVLLHFTSVIFLLNDKLICFSSPSLNIYASLFSLFPCQNLDLWYGKMLDDGFELAVSSSDDELAQNISFCFGLFRKKLFFSFFFVDFIIFFIACCRKERPRNTARFNSKR